MTGVEGAVRDLTVVNPLICFLLNFLQNNAEVCPFI
jgi:hypothetical protein